MNRSSLHVQKKTSRCQDGICCIVADQSESRKVQQPSPWLCHIASLQVTGVSKLWLLAGRFVLGKKNKNNNTHIPKKGCKTASSLVRKVLEVWESECSCHEYKPGRLWVCQLYTYIADLSLFPRSQLQQLLCCLVTMQFVFTTAVICKMQEY